MGTLFSMLEGFDQAPDQAILLSPEGNGNALNKVEIIIDYS